VIHSTIDRYHRPMTLAECHADYRARWS
jgi:hypothetical protein